MLSRIMILVGLLLVVVGVLLMPTTESAPPQSQANIATTTPERETSAASIPTETPDPILTGAVDLPVFPVEPPQLDNVIWQDSFDSQGSGWEPRYQVPRQYADAQMVNWNGYNNGAYVFALNGIPTVEGTFPLMLWDFNASYRLPAYPYRVRADVSVHPAGNALLLLDYVGDYGELNKGDGLAVVWGQSDGYAYSLVEAWPFTVYEFHSGHTWKLGCSTPDQRMPDGIVSTAVVDVDRDVLTVRFYSSDSTDYEAQCRRVQPGRVEQPRALGIGMAYPRPGVPVSDYNFLQFEHLYVMQIMDEVTVPVQKNEYTEVANGCTANWQGGYTTEDAGITAIPIGNVLRDRTDCSNWYATYASDFPGYGPTRVAMPDTSHLEGNWYCGSEAPSSRFSLYRENDYLRLLMDNETFYVFGAKDIYPHQRLSSDDSVIPFGYIVTRSPEGGNPTTFVYSPFVAVGDGIGAADGMRYYFTEKNGVMSTNWTAQECLHQ
jgi:hypothetical protein